MNFSPKTKAWIQLICLVVSTGGTVTIATYLGGAKLWIAILAGLGTSGSNVYHALAASPGDVEKEIPIETKLANASSQLDKPAGRP